MDSTADRVDGVLSGPDSTAIACRGVASGVLVGLGLVVAAYVLGVDGGGTVIKLGYAVVAGLAVGEVMIGRCVHSGDGLTTQPKSFRSLRAVGVTVGVALTVFPFTLHPVVVDMIEATAVSAGGRRCYAVRSGMVSDGATQRPRRPRSDPSGRCRRTRGHARGRTLDLTSPETTVETVARIDPPNVRRW